MIISELFDTVKTITLLKGHWSADKPVKITITMKDLI